MCASYAWIHVLLYPHVHMESCIWNLVPACAYGIYGLCNPTHPHTYTHVCIHTYMYIRAQSMYIYIYVYIYIYIYVYMYIYLYSCIHTHAKRKRDVPCMAIAHDQCITKRSTQQPNQTCKALPGEYESAYSTINMQIILWAKVFAWKVVRSGASLGASKACACSWHVWRLEELACARRRQTNMYRLRISVSASWIVPCGRCVIARVWGILFWSMTRMTRLITNTYCTKKGKTHEYKAWGYKYYAERYRERTEIHAREDAT